MKKYLIKDGIYDVGVVDWNVRNFHGYSTERGSSYNAYLILDEKITLVDTVKGPFAEELIERISEVIDPSKIDYIISNHVEMDHSGAIPAIMKVAPNAEIVTSAPSGLKGLLAHYGSEFKYKEVKAGDCLSLGKRSLCFVPTPMVHWPDNMVTYCPEEKILFSNDAFGQHYATSKRFEDENAIEEVMQEAIKYYSNIVMPYGAQTRKALEIVAGLEVDMILPSHGVAWRSNVKDILDKYDYYTNDIPDKKAIIVYDSMWQSTEKMANAIAEGFRRKEYIVKMFDLKGNHISDVVTEVLKAEYIVVGSPTLNNNLLPTVSGFLTYMKGLAPKNKKGFAFGSYGWGGQSIGQVNDELVKCNFDIVMDPVRMNYIPTKEQLRELEDKVAEL